MSVYAYSKNLGLKFIDYDRPNWHEDEYDNLAVLDAILGNYTALTNIVGRWRNATIYSTDQIVVDPDTGDLYKCLVNNTSASTGTFEQQRSAQPTWWTLVLSSTSSGGLSYSSLPAITSAQLGLVGNGTTDDSIVLQESFDTTQNSGIGRTYDLTAAGGAFYFNRPLLLPNLSRVRFNSPVIFGPRGCFHVRGEPVYLTNEYDLAADFLINSTTASVSTETASAFTVGDYVLMTGEGGNIMPFAAERIFRVSSKTTNSLTFSKPTCYNFYASYSNGEYYDYYETTNKSKLRKIKAYPLTVNATEASYTVTVSTANIGGIAVDDIVMIFDLKRVMDKNPADVNNYRYIHFSLARVVEVNTSTGVITLDRPVSRSIETAHDAAICVMNMKQGVIIENAKVSFSSAPLPTTRHVFHLEYCYHCGIIGGGTYEKFDTFGHRGDAVHIEHCLETFVKDFNVGPANYHASGEGYGIGSFYSTDCYAVNCIAHRRRHGFLDQGSTRFRVIGSASYNAGSSDFDLHGCEEVNTTFIDVEAVGGPFVASGVSTRRGLAMGSSHRGGSIGPRIRGINVKEYNQSGDAGIFIGANIIEPSITSFRIINCYEGVKAQPTNDEATTKIYLTSGQITGCTTNAIFFNSTGTTTTVWQNVHLSDITIRNCGDGVIIRRASGLLTECEISELSHTVYNYAVDFKLCDDFVCRFNFIHNTLRGFKFKDSPNCSVTFNAFEDITNTTLLLDDGGNTNLRFILNDTIGVSNPSFSTTSTPSTGRIVGVSFLGDSDARYTVTTTAPSSSDTGYGIGARWIDTATNKEYVCTKSVSPAVWVETTQTAGTGSSTFSDASFVIQDNTTTTKQLKFEVSTISASTTRTITVPDEDIDLGLLTRMSGLIITESTTARTIAAGDRNRVIRCTNSAAVTVTLNSGVITVPNGEICWILLYQTGSGTISVSGTATIVDVIGTHATTGTGQKIMLETFDGTTFYSRVG